MYELIVNSWVRHWLDAAFVCCPFMRCLCHLLILTNPIYGVFAGSRPSGGGLVVTNPRSTRFAFPMCFGVSPLVALHLFGADRGRPPVFQISVWWCCRMMLCLPLFCTLHILMFAPTLFVCEMYVFKKCVSSFSCVFRLWDCAVLRWAVDSLVEREWLFPKYRSCRRCDGPCDAMSGWMESRSLWIWLALCFFLQYFPRRIWFDLSALLWMPILLCWDGDGLSVCPCSNPMTMGLTEWPREFRGMWFLYFVFCVRLLRRIPALQPTARFWFLCRFGNTP